MCGHGPPLRHPHRSAERVRSREGDRVPPHVRHPAARRAPSAARKQKTNPLYDRLDAKGAQWEGSMAGSVRSTARPSHTPSSAATPSASSPTRSKSFASGRDRRPDRLRQVRGHSAGAAKLLDRVSANKIPGKDGGAPRPCSPNWAASSVRCRHPSRRGSLLPELRDHGHDSRRGLAQRPHPRRRRRDRHRRHR